MLSVILPNYQHFDVTKAHVREVMNSTVMPDEIIVVNDGGGKELKDILKTLDKKTKIIYAYILPPKIEWNYNGAVNLGVWLSRGDFLAIEDNDNIPFPNYYEEVLKHFKEYPKAGRVFTHQRREIRKADVGKPSSEWEIIGKRGPNMGSYVIKREVYTMLKGQDEQMCGRYGWMYYDWKHRMLAYAKIEFGQAGYFWYVVDGQTNLDRKSHKENYWVYRRNARAGLPHSKHGILNFQFEVEEL